MFCRRIRQSFLVLALFCCAASLSFAQPQKASAQVGRKKVALVLSGGGAKGMAHIGVIRVLEQVGIPVDIVTGTSMGSLVGGLYAIGYDAASLDSIVHNLDWQILLSDRPNRRTLNLEQRQKQSTYLLSKPINLQRRRDSTTGYIAGVNINRVLKQLTSAYPDSLDFDNLPRPFACVATNIIDNSEVVLSKGVLADAMRTSMAIPGVFTPIVKEGMVLVDGGLRNNYPVDVARSMGADIVIGVTLQDDGRTAEQIRTGMDVINQIIDINCKNKFDENLAATDVAIRVNCKGYGSLSFTPEAVDTLIWRGETEALRHLEELQSVAALFSAGDIVSPTVPTPSAEESEALVRKEASLEVNVGARFDTEEMAAVQINGAYTFAGTRPLALEATVRLGSRIMTKFDASLSPKNWGKIGLSYIFRHDDTNIYLRGHRNHNTTYNEHMLNLRLFTFYIHNVQINFSAAWNYYHFTNILSGHPENTNPVSIRDTHFYRYQAQMLYDSEDNTFFTTRGSKLDASYGYYTDDLARWNNHTGLHITAAMWRTTFRVAPFLSLQPMAYGRIVIGNDAPAALMNFVGGARFGRYLDSQMPFAGVGHVEPLRNAFVATALKAQARIFSNHFIFLRFAVAEENNKLKHLFSDDILFGTEAAYYYNTAFGPLGGSLGWSTLTKKPCFYVNLGFDF